MMTLISGFTRPPIICFKFITKCDKCYYKVRQLFLLQSAMVCYYKVRQLFYYKVRQVLQSVTILLQSATGITKCNDYYKVRQYNFSCPRPYNVSIGKLSSFIPNSYNKSSMLSFLALIKTFSECWSTLIVMIYVYLRAKLSTFLRSTPVQKNIL